MNSACRLHKESSSADNAAALNGNRRLRVLFGYGDMQDLRSKFIPGTPLRDAAYFTGPLSWWSNGLVCGGVERQVVSGAQYFHDKGRPITLLCQNVEARYGNAFFLADARRCCRSVLQFSQDQIDMAALGHVRNIVATLLQGCSPYMRDSIACLALWLLRIRPRLLQIWNADNLNPLLAAVIAGVPHIIIAGQSLSPLRRSPYGFEGVDEGLGFTILANIMRLPGVYMTNNSRAGCRDYENWLGLPRGTVTCTPNVFDLAQWPRPDAARVAALRQQLGLPEGARVLGGLFRFVSIKDPELWVCTALRACAEHPDLYAMVGGDGPELPALKERIAASPFAGRILFPGAIKDVPAFLSLCTAFLHTAHVEGLPNVVLEAQAYETPVVTTRCGGVADIVAHGESGFIVDDRDENVLARHIDLVLRHPDFATQAGHVGRERVARNFCPEVAMPPLWNLYETILAGVDEAASPPKQAASAAGLEVGKEASPLVSIVLAVCSPAPFLQETVASALGQTYLNIELIIVRGDSSDATAACLETLAAPRVRVLNAPGMRLPAALNRGFALARGEYLTWASADNVYLPHFCETLVRALETTPQAGFASAPFAYINDKGFVADYSHGEATLDRMLCRNEGMAAFMYRRDAALQAGEFNMALEGAEDWDMWLRILELARPVYALPLACYVRLRHAPDNDAQQGRNRQAAVRAVFRALQRLEKRGGIKALYPQIAECADREQALFHANLLFGSRMLGEGSLLRAKAADYLARAHALRPDDLAALGNYAVALAYLGRDAEAQALFRKGESADPETFSLLRERCARQRHTIGTDSFKCPTLECPGARESELVRRVEQSRLVFGD